MPQETAAERTMILNADSVSNSQVNALATATLSGKIGAGQRCFILGIEADYSGAVTGFKEVQVIPDDDAGNVYSFQHDFGTGPLRMTLPTPVKSKYGTPTVAPRATLAAGGVGITGTITLFFAVR